MSPPTTSSTTKNQENVCVELWMCPHIVAREAQEVYVVYVHMQISKAIIYIYIYIYINIYIYIYAQ